MRGRPLRPWIALALAALSAGCVSMAPRSRLPGPRATTLDAVPLVTFGIGDCGAGSLAAVFAALGRPVPASELDAALPKTANGGVLTLDLMLEARARGFGARLSTGTPETIAAALGRGTPPILALRVVDAPGTRRDFYHYVVADGFDEELGLVRLQFGDGRRRWTSFERIERSWRAAGHALVVVEERSAAEPAPSLPQVAYAVVLEGQGRLDEAATLYAQWLEESPDSVLLWTNLGNIEAARGRRAEAEAAYRRALALQPDAADALNNLAWLLLESDDRLAEAETLARRAVEADGPDPHLALDTLARAELQRGQCPGAVATAERALALAPAGAAERPALEQHAAAARAACGAVRARP